MRLEFIEAAERGDVTKVQDWIRQGGDLNVVDGRGRTAAMAATHGDRPEVLKLLIEAGADINIRDHRSDNPLLLAGADGLMDILRLAIEAGADTKLTNRYGGTALIPASDRGHVEIVRELLTRTDVDVNHVNNLGWTALMEAIVLGDGGQNHQQIVKLLITHGADVNLPDRDGISPLAHASKRGYHEIAGMLQAAGAE
ncbi:ankyrin [Paenibacillus swuensis]|uniref:Ankyrin n=2 Tax=Paenibacillus swuensis TaxID=1178515 RepID=A0A172TMK3_9BACL|nr:ankyrin [Paenibacillus swuensis]